LIGETLGGRYHIVEKVGRGGMAEVYKAHQPGLDRYVAVKILHSFLAQERDFLDRFQREAKAVAAFRHANIVQVFDFAYDEERDIYYMVMEFIDGPSLKGKLQDWNDRGELMPLGEALGVGIDIGKALDYAHRQGMVHRDVKPANIMFTVEGQAVLTDFGIAKIVNVSGLTASGAMVGTPAYISPEQGMGRAGDERSDVYSLGIVVYQMITGVLPFEADTAMGVVLKHISEPLIPPREHRPGLPAKIEQAVLPALAKDPEERYQTAADFASAMLQPVAGLEGYVPDLETTQLGRTAQKVLTTAPQVGIPDEVEEKAADEAVVEEEQEPLLVVPRRRRSWRTVGLLIALLAALGAGAVVFREELLQALGGVLNGIQITGATPSPSPTPDLASTHTAATLEAIQATLEAPTLTPEPTSTPSPPPDLTATAVAMCDYDLEVALDRMVYPVVLMPGQAFVKRWEFENTGSCAWPDGVELVYVSGEELEIVEEPEIDPIEPDESIEVGITLRAPTTYSAYSSVWQMEDGDGNPIGEELEITCRVGPTPTPVPVEPSPTPTPEEVASSPLWMSLPVLAGECDGSASGGYHGGRVEWAVSGGSYTNYRFFYGAVVVEQELPTPFNEFYSLPHSQTYFTVVGPGDVLPTLEDCGLSGWGDAGYCVTPGGYEVVWQKVWVDEGMCH
jgi:tRNA A-37 threonylcarbamoyl transferase component Bud32